ncbi:MAG TPA: TMEM175 family protein [Acidimicrobiales bacterium]
MVSKGRLEAFSDGVLAIAITLLVIEIRPPTLEAGQSLASGLWDQWPSYVAYVVSFMQIGVIWLNHHRMFQTVRAVDGTLLLLNLLLLMWVALIPFPTAVVAAYLQDGGSDATTAMALYGGVLLLTAISFVALYAWITHDERIAGTLPSRRALRAARVRFSIGLLAYTVAFGLSWVSPPAALALTAAMALYYAFDQASIQTDEVAAPVGSS